ncbi:MAG TPA: DNA repair protein RecO [Candidatus Pacebacteria bacterium]|nr:DNA repair protein RecO [Candidatus Paceibacterota bacterium]
MARTHSILTQGLVLKRINTGEADRVVTLLTPDLGKIVCLAKGARKLISSQRGNLEPGNRVKVFLIPTKSMMLLTQSKLLTDLGMSWQNLSQLRRITQILEIVDRLIIEAEADPQLYLQVGELLTAIQTQTASDTQVRNQLDMIIQNLGHPSLENTKHHTINDYVTELVEHKLHSFEYLKVS